jgi:hypothetical protein
MDEQDLWSIELVPLCTLYQNAMRKPMCITCIAQSSFGQLQKTGKLQFGQGLVVLKIEQSWMDEQDLGWLELIQPYYTFQECNYKANLFCLQRSN